MGHGNIFPLALGREKAAEAGEYYSLEGKQGL